MNKLSRKVPEIDLKKVYLFYKKLQKKLRL